jgi:DNA-binding PadR family transcriptional regulator
LDDALPTTADEEPRTSRFELAPPRRFVLPAILLLLSEAPGHGYSLEKDLRDLNFGRIDRPTVYRALALLEKDGLVGSHAEVPTAGHERRVYGVTPLGERVLGVWMAVIKEERDLLGRVLRRYQATGTPDAILAEVDGGWAAALGSGWSPVSPTSGAPRHLRPVATDRFDSWFADEEGDAVQVPEPGLTPAADETHRNPSDDPPPAGPARQRFQLSPDRSVVLIDVRSTVGPISFGAIGLTGYVEAMVAEGGIDLTTPPSAHLEVAVDGLRSGNSVYDAELLRRIDARRFPTAQLELTGCSPSGQSSRFTLTGELTFHGVTRAARGTVAVEVDGGSRLVVTGEQVFDIRDFDVPSPTVLMLRIYPDVRVHLHVEAELEGG